MDYAQSFNFDVSTFILHIIFICYLMIYAIPYSYTYFIDEQSNMYDFIFY